MRATATVLFIMLASGCDERAVGRGPIADADSREPRPRAEADTVVRLVKRYVTQPAAVQRVSGAFTAKVALRSLDSTLAIRVLDNRGGEVVGVPVRWTLVDAGDSASLRVIDATSDSAGVSRASFTPGLSAGVQRVIAEVSGVRRIEFPVTVPARANRNLPAVVTLWSGDDTTVTAALRDADGNALHGGEVTWASTDTSTARVERAAGTDARIIAVAAGSAEIHSFVEAGKVRGTTRVTVRPVIRGRIVTLDGSAPPPLRVAIQSDGVRDTLAAAGGSVSARIPLDPDADVVLRVLLPSGAAYHAGDVRVGAQRDLQSLTIALVPRRFTIDAGPYLGQTVDIDAAAAMRRGGRGAPFWRLVPLSGDTPRKLLGWRDADFPLRVAFNRQPSNGRMDAGDSTAFWAIADRMEADLGRDLFTPAQPGDSIRGTIARVELRPQSSEGHTFVAWAQAGDAQEGVLIFREAATLRDAHVVTHELVHLVGFGHATGWATVSQPAGGTAQRLTAEDVAYIQLAMRLRSLQERTGARPAVP
ncbi:MAG TPA: hypothetical protein VEB19_02175 [Gemmatimonadaceae bacterium]|nr:hypothetical protein [Gemmatimonadaceae bacterium]